MNLAVCVLVLFCAVSSSFAQNQQSTLQCMRCRSLTSRATNNQAVAQLLNEYNNVGCVKDVVDRGTRGMVPVSCAPPPSGMVARCGFTEGRANAQYTYYEDPNPNNRGSVGNNENPLTSGRRRSTTFNMEVRMWDCMHVMPSTPIGCKQDPAGTRIPDRPIQEDEFAHASKSLAFLDGAKLTSYTGDICFCDTDRCTHFNAGQSIVASVAVMVVCVVVSVVKML